MRNYKYTVLAAIAGAALLSGCSAWQRGDGDRTAGRVMDDKKITANIKDRLEDETVYKFPDVDVRTFNGVVQLSGFVKTEDQKQRAGQVAEQSPGVARVVNSIVLKASEDNTLTPTGREDTGTPAPRTNPSATNNLNHVDQ